MSREQIGRSIEMAFTVGRVIGMFGLAVAMWGALVVSYHQKIGKPIQEDDHDKVIRIETMAQSVDQRLANLEERSRQRDEKIGRIDERTASDHNMLLWIGFSVGGIAIAIVKERFLPVSKTHESAVQKAVAIESESDEEKEGA